MAARLLAPAGALDGMRPDGILGRRYASTWIFSAVQPGIDAAFAMVLTETSAAAMQAFLDRCAATLAPEDASAP